MNTSKILNILPRSLRVEKGSKLRNFHADQCECHPEADITSVESGAELLPRTSNSEIVFNILANGVYPYKRVFR
jgi:hypothetical protein